MPKNIKEMFVQVFSRIPQKVVWKWEEDDLVDKDNSLSANVKIVKWLPQQDLLGKQIHLWFSFLHVA